MARATSNFPTETAIGVSTSMVFRKVMANMYGVMEAIIRVTLSRVFAMASVFGRKIMKKIANAIEGIICLIENQVMVCTYGRMVITTKESFSKMFVMATGSFSQIMR
jgi:hypothetical protein